MVVLTYLLLPTITILARKWTNGSKLGNDFARNVQREFGVARSRSEELEVNQWIALDIPILSSESEHAKNSIHCFSIY